MITIDLFKVFLAIIYSLSFGIGLGGTILLVALLSEKNK